MKQKLVSIATFFSSLVVLAQTNTNLGTQAGNFGTNNTSIGFYAGNDVLSSWNTFVGSSSGTNTTNGFANTFIGSQSGQVNQSGSNNVHLGYRSGWYSNGSLNVFIGSKVATNNSSGFANTFIGYQAGTDNSTGYGNIFMGYNSGYGNEIGFYNVFIGNLSGRKNHDGRSNVFLGYNSGYENFLGDYNVFLGAGSGAGNVGGHNNVYVGNNAGASQLGSNNVFIGNGADYSGPGQGNLVVANNNSNSLLFGNFTENHLAIGGVTAPGLWNPYTLYVFGEAFSTANWLVSDMNFKEEIEPVKGALAAIDKLEGKTFKYKDGIRSFKLPKGKQVGFIAQEVEEILPELVRTHQDGTKAVNYDGVIPFLIEAVKELKEIQETYEDRIKTLETLLAANQVETIENSNTDQSPLVNYELKNTPNPANNETIILYSLPNGIENVQILVFDLQGKEVKAFENLSLDRGKLRVTKSDVGEGIFNYALVADGEIIETKKMILR